MRHTCGEMDENNSPVAQKPAVGPVGSSWAEKRERHLVVATWLKVASCAALLLCTVASTLFIEASKSADGSFPYNSFTIPCAVEACKFCISGILLVISKLSGKVDEVFLDPRRFAYFSLPAMCYFISNNCALLVVRELGPTTYQVSTNLKVLTTGILMRAFLGRRLSWLRWKALILLVLGTVVTQLPSECFLNGEKGNFVGYVFVFVNSLASGAGGVVSELLLKSGTQTDSIHWQNMQLYAFGFVFGLATSLLSSGEHKAGLFVGFNPWAYACIASLSLGGILVSFVLKYIDNFAKCFVASFSIITVSAAQCLIYHEAPKINVVVGITLTCMALEQYNMN